jgi:hypothetical protein
LVEIECGKTHSDKKVLQREDYEFHDISELDVSDIGGLINSPFVFIVYN